jgi:site-specific recombinase XerD
MADGDGEPLWQDRRAFRAVLRRHWTTHQEMASRAHRLARPECRKLFISRHGDPCTPDLFRQSLEDNLKRTGLDKELGNDTISAHTLRHFFCTMYLVNGGTLQGLQKITGHKSLDTLMVYVNLAQQMTMVKEEHKKASPLSNALRDAEQKKRQAHVRKLTMQFDKLGH